MRKSIFTKSFTKVFHTKNDLLFDFIKKDLLKKIFDFIKRYFKFTTYP